jgi:hypothetical protein
MIQVAPVVVAAFPDGSGGLVLIIERPLGWDAPHFRDPVTGRDGRQAGPVPRRRDSRVQVRARPGPARGPVKIAGP